MQLVLAFAMSWLSLYDPVGYHHMGPFWGVVKEESPIIRAGIHYLGWADGLAHTIALDWPAIQSRYQGGWDDEWDAKADATCKMVHEATHLEASGWNEELPLLREYLCLDRLGASRAMKDGVYRSLEALLPLGEGSE